MTHLWEVNHPYYMTEGNYYANDCHTRFETLDEFLSGWGDSDPDYNFVVRWDWLEGEDWGAGEYRGDDYYRNGVFKVQFVLQRKAKLLSCEISVCRADEPRIREWLEPRFAYAMAMWAPFAPSLSDSKAGLADATPNGSAPAGEERT